MLFAAMTEWAEFSVDRHQYLPRSVSSPIHPNREALDLMSEDILDE